MTQQSHGGKTHLSVFFKCLSESYYENDLESQTMLEGNIEIEFNSPDFRIGK